MYNIDSTLKASWSIFFCCAQCFFMSRDWKSFIKMRAILLISVGIFSFKQKINQELQIPIGNKVAFKGLEPLKPI